MLTHTILNSQKKQIRLWNDLSRVIRHECPTISYWHCAATAGSSYAAEIDANIMRIGIGIYGFCDHVSVSPALSMVTRITTVRTVQKGESVGYNATYTATQDRIVATIPVGYFEGVDRRLSNRGFVSVGGVPCPIVGRVSMNVSSIDVTDVPRVRVGDEVIVYSATVGDQNSVTAAARIAGAIPYELLVTIPQHLRRVIY